MTETKIQNATVQSERANCTVVAVMHCFDIPYSDAYSKLEKLGRSRNRGFYFRGKNIEKLGLVCRFDLARKRLSSILPFLSKGRFIVRKSEHVFAVVNGKVFDKCKHCITEMVYEL